MSRASHEQIHTTGQSSMKCGGGLMMGAAAANEDEAN
jgi:hypothetical protein